MFLERIVLVVAILSLAGCRNTEEHGSAAVPQNPESRSGTGDSIRQNRLSPQDSLRMFRSNAQTRMDTVYAALEKRLDSLWMDSLNVPSRYKVPYRRILEEARTVKDNTKVYLDELRVSPEAVTPQIWEEMRARADYSLDSLRRLFISADSTRKLESDG